MKPKSLVDLRVDTDVLLTDHGATPAKWYFSPKDQTLLGGEISVTKDDDPCELLTFILLQKMTRSGNRRMRLIFCSRYKFVKDALASTSDRV